MKVVTWLTVITSARRASASASTALLLWRSRIRICLQVHCSYNSRSFFVWLYAALTASVARPLPSTARAQRLSTTRRMRWSQFRIDRPRCCSAMTAVLSSTTLLGSVRSHLHRQSSCHGFP